MKIHHIGIIVRDISKNIEIYKSLNYSQITKILYDEHQNIKVCFIESEDKTQVIELIEAIDESSSIYNFKEGYHHICYEVSGEKFIDEFRKLKIGKIFTSPILAPALKNSKVVFACLINGTFVEFILSKREKE